MKEIRSLINYGGKIQVGADGIDFKLIPYQNLSRQSQICKKNLLKFFGYYSSS
jgi:hypothetical protein